MIRRLEASLSDLARIHALCFDQGWSAGVFADLAVKPHHRIYVAEEDGAVVSFIVLTVVAGEGEILTLATDPAHQGRGLAGELLTHVVAELRDEGALDMVLEVAVDNAPALALYRRFGFQRVGLRKAYYSRAGGVPVDGYTLRLALA